MPTENILDIVQQAHDIGFRGSVCLSHYNEPLYDQRLPQLGKDIKNIGDFNEIFFHSNGEILTEEMARSLDGIFDRIVFSIYGPENAATLQKIWIQSLFKYTLPDFVSSEHIATHYSPIFNIEELIKENIDSTCNEPAIRLIFNFKGEMLFCCDDVIGEFKLGSFPETPVKELWINVQPYINILKKPGGRRIFSFCSTCPRGGS